MAMNRGGTTRIALDPSAVTPAELVRVQRLARELRLTDQILSPDVDSITVQPTGPAPAWTSLDGDAVSFAYDQLPHPDSKHHVAVWLGVNAHELGHVLYSPRRDSTLMYRVLESERTFLAGVAMMHNIVEDQRQERLLLGRFAPWSAYLTAALSHVLDATVGDAWLLFAGRTWLPQSARDKARNGMTAKHGQVVTDRVTAIIGQYQHLLDPAEDDADEAWDLLQELHATFGDAMPNIKIGCRVMEGGEPGTGEPGASAPPSADEAAESDGDGNGDDADDGSADGDGDGTADGDGDGDGAHGSSDSPSSSSGGGGAGGETDRTSPPTIGDLKQDLQDAADDAVDGDAATADDLQSVLDSLDNASGSGDRAHGDRSLGRNSEPTDTARTLRHEVEDALLDLKDQSEPGWLKRTDAGRLNVRRLLNPNTPPDEMFDRYEPGQMDATELEVMVLLDISGSMSGNERRLGESAWAIRHAVDAIEGRCTVLTWDNGPYGVLADGNDRPDDRMFLPDTRGGTDPLTALTEAFRLIVESQARNRMVVILTDGDWASDGPVTYTAGGKAKRGASTAERMIGAMNEYGIITVCALLGAGAGVSLHGCRFGGPITDPLDLARLFRTVAADQFQAALAGR